MTEKQKKAFLKAEGWSQRRDSEFGDLIWVDPKGESERWNTPTAFAIASRRRRQREARKLKAAGFQIFGRGSKYWVSNAHTYTILGKTLHHAYTRQEALQTLEKQP